MLGRLFGNRERASRRLAFEGRDFQLHLNGDWIEIPDSDPDRRNFTSEGKRTAIVISTTPVRLPRSRLLEAAERLAEARRNGEQAVPGRKVTFGENWVELKADGELGHVAYAGYDDAGTIFRFMGWATEAKILSLWVSTETNDNLFSKRVFDEVFAGFRFYVP